jgi:hypothetical protein
MKGVIIMYGYGNGMYGGYGYGGGEWIWILIIIFIIFSLFWGTGNNNCPGHQRGC